MKPVKTTQPQGQNPVIRTHNSDDPPKALCRAFNLGTCRAKGLKCPAGNGDRVHQCYYCLGANHMGKDCRSPNGGPAANTDAWKPGGGKKKNRSKNKNKNGKWT